MKILALEVLTRAVYLNLNLIGLKITTTSVKEEEARRAQAMQ